MDFMPLRLNSSSLTCSICALAAIILQLVATECQKLHMSDSPINLHGSLGRSSEIFSLPKLVTRFAIVFKKAALELMLVFR